MKFLILITLSLLLSHCASSQKSSDASWQDISYAPKGDTFSPDNGEYIFSHGDIVEVYVHRQPGLSGSYLVKKSGFIELPKVGPVYAYKRSVQFLKSAIRIKLRPHMKYPKVDVSTGRLSSYKVTISGQIRKPGVYTYNNRTTLLEGIAQAGGILTKASQVVLIRADRNGKRSRYVTDYGSLLNGSMGVDNLVLERGDIIFVN